MFRISNCEHPNYGPSADDYEEQDDVIIGENKHQNKWKELFNVNIETPVEVEELNKKDTVHDSEEIKN